LGTLAYFVYGGSWDWRRFKEFFGRWGCGGGVHTDIAAKLQLHHFSILLVLKKHLSTVQVAYVASPQGPPLVPTLASNLVTPLGQTECGIHVRAVKKRWSLALGFLWPSWFVAVTVEPRLWNSPSIHFYTVFQKKGSHQTFGSNFVKS